MVSIRTALTVAGLPAALLQHRWAGLFAISMSYDRACKYDAWPTSSGPKPKGSTVIFATSRSLVLERRSLMLERRERRSLVLKRRSLVLKCLERRSLVLKRRERRSLVLKRLERRSLVLKRPLANGSCYVHNTSCPPRDKSRDIPTNLNPRP